MEKRERYLFRFEDQSDFEAWFSINDVIMGGLSAGRLEDTGRGTAAFTGDVSLEQGGGFASVRGRLPGLDLRGYSGLELRVRGDGKRYKLRLVDNRAVDVPNYDAVFQTPAGVWQMLTFPFDGFEPIFRGRRVPQAGPLDLSQIAGVGFLIADRQAGSFKLEIDWIRAVSGSRQTN